MVADAVEPPAEDEDACLLGAECLWAGFFAVFLAATVLCAAVVAGVVAVAVVGVTGSGATAGGP